MGPAASEYTWIGVGAACTPLLCLAAFVSGMTLGLFGLDRLELEVGGLLLSLNHGMRAE